VDDRRPDATLVTDTIAALIARGHEHAVAIAAGDRPFLSYAGLRRHVDATVAALNGFGIGHNDPVGIVLPNGPEMASAFVSVAAAATAAPLNPAYRADEFAFYLADLRAKALIVAAGASTPAREVAARQGIRVLELAAAQAAPAGCFTLRADGRFAGKAQQPGPGTAADTALVLHTSGTTARPKIVPLTQRNLCASADAIRRSLALTPEDRCLNVMPLFHIHGLMAAVLASLAAGAAVLCTPGLNALRFFAWLKQFYPTWYTAAPAMHRAILARAGPHHDLIQRAKLRLVRSCSAALPPEVMAALEGTFHCPVIETYGMTEAAHQMTSNPLPPPPRKPGSVGIAAGPEIAVMGPAGELLPPGAAGEVVIRGPNVMRAYRNNPEANASAFTDGWFRTGDQGVLDEDGYLTITGRLKEMINRGGAKIAPLEIDYVLNAHPAVAQAVTFALPHPILGEEVAAAVVLRDHHDARELDIRGFAAERLAPFKVPRKIVFLDELPTGATGKVQRIGLAKKLGLCA
jgi:acyl-CoA synthetase (AMP-forming)/AMP-acid ligase II